MRYVSYSSEAIAILVVVVFLSVVASTATFESSVRSLEGSGGTTGGMSLEGRSNGGGATGESSWVGRSSGGGGGG